MQFSQITTALGLLGLALAGPARQHKRTAAQIESDLSTVSTDLTAFDASINAFTGSLIQALSLLSSYNTLAGAVTAATSEVTSTGALASSDSATIYAAVNSLTTQITTTLTDTSAKVIYHPQGCVRVLTEVVTLTALVVLHGRVLRIRQPSLQRPVDPLGTFTGLAPAPQVARANIPSQQSDAAAFYKALEGTSKSSCLGVVATSRTRTDIG